MKFEVASHAARTRALTTDEARDNDTPRFYYILRVRLQLLTFTSVSCMHAKRARRVVG